MPNTPDPENPDSPKPPHWTSVIPILVLGVILSLIVAGLADGLSGTPDTILGEEVPTTSLEIAVYIIAGGVWTFLILWAMRRR